MAVSVKTLTLTLSTWTKGQKGHMKCGRFQRCSRAAWNCGGEKKKSKLSPEDPRRTFPGSNNPLTQLEMYLTYINSRMKTYGKLKN